MTKNVAQTVSSSDVSLSRVRGGETFGGPLPLAFKVQKRDGPTEVDALPLATDAATSDLIADKLRRLRAGR